MKRYSLYIITIAVSGAFGFWLGCPQPVKAAGASRILHVEMKGDSEPIPGWGLGTVVGISCPKESDCYVLMQGN